MIKQEKEFAYVLGDIKYDRLGEKDYMKNRATKVEYQRKNKSEQNYMREDGKSLKGLETFEFLFVWFWNLAWITSITSN